MNFTGEKIDIIDFGNLWSGFAKVLFMAWPSRRSALTNGNWLFLLGKTHLISLSN
jgi:hypothetical protein